VLLKIVCLFLFSLLIISCKQQVKSEEENEKILNILQNYVDAWRDMNEERVMSLFEENSIIQPNSLTPSVGKEEIRAFWFPKDGSITKINVFETELLGLNIIDTLAVTTHRSYLDWSYQKDTLNFGMVQKGISTTVYRKQQDQSWKIWRQMWTDIYAKRK
jgi:ketosteroid isomerase-like protein